MRVFTSLAQPFGVAVDGLDQGTHVLGRGVLADAMAQVKNMGRSRLVWIGVWSAKAVQDGAGLLSHLLGGGKQDVGVKVALQGLARPPHRPAHLRARPTQTLVIGEFASSSAIPNQGTGSPPSGSLLARRGGACERAQGLHSCPRWQRANRKLKNAGSVGDPLRHGRFGA